MSVRGPEEVCELVKRYKTKQQEYFLVLTLDGAHQPIKLHVVTIGLVNRTIVHPREVFYRAIKDLSTAILLIHNHPSGKNEPSQEDREITKRLAEAGELLGIEVLDHLIISRTGFYSFAENGGLK